MITMRCVLPSVVSGSGSKPCFYAILPSRVAPISKLSAEWRVGQSVRLTRGQAPSWLGHVEKLRVQQPRL